VTAKLRHGFIAAPAEARSEAAKHSSATGFHSKEYALVEKLATAIDDIAEHLTGDRELFWSKTFAYLATPAPGHKGGALFREHK
jgi:hypothetical protein